VAGRVQVEVAFARPVDLHRRDALIGPLRVTHVTPSDELERGLGVGCALARYAPPLALLSATPVQLS
jgi:hypothetical protein